MAIPVNQFSDSALAAIASQRMPQLNLPLADKSAVGEYLQGQAGALFKQQQLKAVYDQMASQYGIQQLQNSGQMDRTKVQAMLEMAKSGQQQQFDAAQNSLTRNNAMDIANLNNNTRLQEVAQTGAYQQGMLGFRAGELGIQQQNANTNSNKLAQDKDIATQELQVKQAHEAILARTQLNSEELNKRQAAAQVLLNRMGSAEFQALPDAAKLASINADIERMHNLGITSDAEYNKIKNADLPTKQILLNYDVGLSSAAKKVKENDAMQSVMPGYSPVTNATKDKLQEGIQIGNEVTKTLTDLKAQNNPSFYNVGIGKTLVGEVSNIAHDVLGTSESDAGQLAKERAGYFASITAAAGPLLKELDAAKYSNRTREIAHELLPNKNDASIGESNAKFDSLIQLVQQTTQMKQDSLKNGIPITDKAYQDVLLRIKAQTSDQNSSSSKSYTLNGKAFDMKAALAAHPGMTESDIVKQAGLS